MPPVTGGGDGTCSGLKSDGEGISIGGCGLVATGQSLARASMPSMLCRSRSSRSVNYRVPGALDSR